MNIDSAGLGFRLTIGGVLKLIIATAALIGSIIGVVVLIRPITSETANQVMLAVQESDDRREVLGSVTQKLTSNVTFNIDANFQKDLVVEGTTLLKGEIKALDQTLNLGNGKVLASNIINSITVGKGLVVSEGSNPLITNTGVTSFQGLTGDIQITSGDGISIDGGVIKAMPQPVPNAFSSILIAGQLPLNAQGSDSLTFVAGDGINLTANPIQQNKIVISANLPNSSTSVWVENGGVIKLFNSSASVGIGTDNPLTKLDVRGAIRLGMDGINNTLGTTASSGNPSGSLFWGNQQLCTKADCTGAAADVSWGDISGSVTAQADLKSSLDAKEAEITAGTTSQYFRGDKSWQALNTSIVPEVTNLYFTNARFNEAFAAKTTTDLIEGANQYYTSARFDSSFGAKTTSSLAEGSNLYYTADRARAAISAGSVLLYNQSTGVLSLAVAGSSTDGYLSSIDWGVFNAKQSSLTFGTGLTNEVGTVTSNLSTGISGGQTMYGGTEASDNLILQSTASGTKGDIYLNPDGGRVGIGTNNPQSTLDVDGTLTTSGDAIIGSILGVAGAATFADTLTVNGTSFTNVGSLNNGGPINLTTLSNTIIGTAVEGAWSLNGNTFTNRRVITTTNTNGTTTLPLGHQVTITLTGAAAIDFCGTTRADNNDIRVAYNSTEVARNIVRSCPTQVDISFQLQAALAPSTSTSAYYIYYTNTSLASAGSTYSYSPFSIDSGDVASNWVSTDNTNYAISQETTIKQEGTGSVKATQIAQPAGDMAALSTTGQSQLPAVRKQTQSVSVTIGGTTYAYVIGGADTNGNKVSTVYRSIIDASGNLGTWSTSGQSQLPTVLTGHNVVTATISGTSYIYVIGGCVTTAFGCATSVIYRATLDASGNVGVFETTNQSQLPSARYDAQSIIVSIGANTYLYVLGGRNGSATITATVYRSIIDSSGNIGALSMVSQGQIGSGGFTGGVVLKATANGINYLYCLPYGWDARVYRAALDSSGNVGTWSNTNQTTFPGGNIMGYNATMTTTATGNYIHIIGGSFSPSGVKQSVVYKSTVGGTGNVGAWTTVNQGTIPQSLDLHSAISYTAAGKYYVTTMGGSATAGNTVVSSVYRAEIISPSYSTTRTLPTVSLASMGGILFNVYSSRTGSYQSFEFSNDEGANWQSYPFAVTSANTWETKTLDISNLASSNKNNLTLIRFRVTDSSVGFTSYYDDVQAIMSVYSGASPTLSGGNKSLGASDLSINSQGSGAVKLNYDATDALAGTGGLILYNGSTTSIFSVSSTGNMYAAGSLGLGVASPQYRLDLVDNAATSGVRGFSIVQSGAVSGTGYGAYIAKTGASTTNVGLYSTATGGTNNYAAIFDQGFVGIGATTPNFTLSVMSNVASGNTASFANLTSTDATTVSVMRLNLGTASTGIASRFMQFYAGSTGDNNGTGVGEIRLNNTGVAYETGSADFAEYFDVEESVANGDIIAITKTGNRKATENTIPLGVVSDTAGFVGNARKTAKQQAIVGLNGQIVVNVILGEEGIYKGDAVAASRIPGYGKKQSDAGYIIGYALDDAVPTACSANVDKSIVCGTVRTYVHIGYTPGSFSSSPGFTREYYPAIVAGDISAHQGRFNTITTTLLNVGDSLMIDSVGNVVTKGSIKATSVETKTIATDELLIKNIAVQEDANGVATAAKSVIYAGKNSVTVSNINVTENSLIFVTLTSKTETILMVTKNTPGESFVVEIPKKLEVDVTFNYWIVN